MSYKVYRAIVVESDPMRRTRLKEVAAAAPCFSQVDGCTNVAQALEILSRDNVDVVFLGHLPSGEIPKFIDQAKGTSFGRLSAYVTLLGSQANSDAAIATNALNGVDGTLFEPFSVDSLVGTTKIADRLKEADAQQRKQAALEMLLDTVVSEVDKFGLALMSKEPATARSSILSLRKIGEQVVHATKALAVDYLGVLTKSLSDAPPPEPYFEDRQAYGGVSRRVQQLLDRKRKNSSH